MTEIKLALLDMNNNHPNQGMRNIREISAAFQKNSEFDVKIEYFDVRYKNEMPNVADFDIFISSGGPGTPHKEGYEWEEKFSNFLDEILAFNRENEQKKFLFLICHSFQLASIHWEIGNVCKRRSYSFGIMPIHKTDEGDEEFLFQNLPDPFFAVDSRAYQLIEPNYESIYNLGAKLVAIEKFRPHVAHLERAIMAIRFSDEIFGTQFHPEADPLGMMENLKDETNKEAMIENYGLEKYHETLDRINDEDKIVLTQAQILPRFLQHAAEQVQKKSEILVC